MNKKGFTLVELLAVIALVAILSGIAVPNILSTINNSKKSAFLMDAKRMVAKAEYLMSLNTSSSIIPPSHRQNLMALRHCVAAKDNFRYGTLACSCVLVASCLGRACTI